MVLLLGEAAQRVLDDDDSAVHDQTKVERPQAHQICRNAQTQHAESGEHHRHRDHGGRNQRSTEIAEQEEQHDDDEQRAFGEVLGYRLDRRIDQCGPVQNGLHHDVRRQRGVDLLQPISDRRRHVAAVLANPHDRGPYDHFRPVLRGRAHADCLACANGGNLI